MSNPLSNTPIPVPAAPPWPSQAELYGAASRYVAAGISLLPIGIDGNKRPAWSYLPRRQLDDGTTKAMWSPYMQRRATAEELHNWFSALWAMNGMAAIGGAVSGNLEILDFDSFNPVHAWAHSVEQRAPGLLDRLVLVQTPRPGLHVYYRSPTSAPNQKLAQRLQVNADDPVPTPKTIIETRAEGGYVVVPPSPGACHSTGRQYVYLTARDLTQVPTITAEEREILVQAARTFNELPPPPPRPVRVPVRRPSDPSSPIDDFNARVDWGELLEPDGWTFVARSGDEEYWRRPGKSDGISATVNYAGAGLLHVFTSNAPPLEADRSYSKFQYVLLTKYGGNFDIARDDVCRQGYGQRSAFPRQRGHHRRRRR